MLKDIKHGHQQRSLDPRVDSLYSQIHHIQKDLVDRDEFHKEQARRYYETLEEAQKRIDQTLKLAQKAQVQPLVPTVDLSPLTRQIQEIWSRIEAVEEKMNTQQKQHVDEKINSYWQEKHPDCFVEHEDGRRILSRDLLEWKHDLLLQELFSRKVEQPKKVRTWPLWWCVGALFVVEMIHVFI